MNKEQETTIQVMYLALLTILEQCGNPHFPVISYKSLENAAQATLLCESVFPQFKEKE